MSGSVAGLVVQTRLSQLQPCHGIEIRDGVVPHHIAVRFAFPAGVHHREWKTEAHGWLEHYCLAAVRNGTNAQALLIVPLDI